MAALSAARSGIKIKNAAGTTWTDVVMGTDIIYNGGLVNINASGYAVAASDTASQTFIGMATKTVDNSAGASGVLAEVCLGGAVINIGFSGTATQATVGDLVYIVDDQTVAVAGTTTNDILCGKVTKFLSATEVEIELITNGA